MPTTDTGRRRLAAQLLSALLAAVALLGAQLLADVRPRLLRVPIEGRDSAALLAGVHDVERDGAAAFRWTTGDARLDADLPWSVAPVLLTLRLGAPPPGSSGTLRVESGGASLAIAAQGRRAYRLLLPAPEGGRLSLRLVGEAVRVPPDPRPVGVRLEGLELARPAGWAPPAWPLALAQLGLVGLASLVAARLELPRWLAAALPWGAAAGLLAAALLAPLFAQSYALRLLAALGGLSAALLLLLPAAEARALRWGATPGLTRGVAAMALLACLVRLAGALYPPFEAHDLPLNLERLVRTIGGTLISTNRSFEFRSGVTVYPPGPYLALLPALLLGLSPALLVQGGNAVVDGLSAAGVAALARAAGASERATLLAGALAAAMPVMLTSLYWGHSAQVFGQALMAPVALALLAGVRRPRSAGFAVGGALLAFALLSHIGVTVVAAVWLGAAWALLLARGTLPPGAWQRLTLALAAAGLAGLALVYAPALALKIEETARVTERVQTEQYASGILIWRAALISFYTLGPPLIVAGLLLAPRALRLPPGGLELGAAWVAVSLLFCGVELATGLQVRYFVFFAPVACLLIALALDGLAGRFRWGSAAAWGLAAIMLAQACASWYGGTFADVQMSMVPLLR